MLKTNFLQKQIALFFLNPFHGSYEELSLSIKKNLQIELNVKLDSFDDGIPFDIPRLTLTNNEINISIAKNRLDVHFLKPNKDNALIIDIAKIVLKETGFNGIGYINSSFVDSDSSPLIALVNKKLNKDNLKEISIRVNIQKDILGYECNNIEDIQYGELIIQKDNDIKKMKGLIITKDINTKPININMTTKFDKTIETILGEFDKQINNIYLLQ